ncbi:MAG: sugar phosphate isomerase/epimerase [Clostridia bacterium]|nr:sugar phosphate isomerase/epimerase [Clostridia bacterium]
MTKLNEMSLGTSTCFCGGIDGPAFRELAGCGIGFIEYSYGFNYYMNTVEFPRHADAYFNLAVKNGVTPWSIHLPFSRRIDISNEDKELRAVTLYTDRTLIRAAGRSGVRVAVLHPSSEPIDGERRPERMRLSREAIIMLREECDRAGMTLAVENLPRTCLCRDSAEMTELLSGTGAGVVFDTNHNLSEDNVHFVDALTDAGLRIVSVHISDYYRDENGVLDERHVLPGEGINDWPKLMRAILRNGYDGPLMYEVSRQPKNRTEKLTVEELADNMRKLRAGKIKKKAD